jgi:hypothetical protein
MRFMMLMIPKVYQGKDGQKVGSDFVPSAEDAATMTRYNEELARAGALISLDGLHPPATGVRVSFASGRPSVTDGPFTEAKEVLGGYWMINVKSRDEAIAWAKKVPAQVGDVIEVRQVFDVEDWPEDLRKAVESETVKAQVEKHAKG